MSHSTETARTAPSQGAQLERARVALPAAFAILLGLFLVAGVGFANPMTIHNAAHDSRHSFAFPCH